MELVNFEEAGSDGRSLSRIRGEPIAISKELRFRFLGHFWHILKELEPELESKESLKE